MKNELHNYDIFPKVFPAGKEVKITIKPLGEHAVLKDSEKLTLFVLGLEDGAIRDFPERKNNNTAAFEVAADGTITLNYVFPKEQQYFLRFVNSDTDKRVLQLSVYALSEDLCGRYPFIGDLHMHTCYSDGNQAPDIVCANYRKTGYDFIVISDHGCYASSLKAISAYKDVPIELNIVQGEEVHMPKVEGYINDTHIVNFGGKYSVNALIDSSDQNRVLGDGREFRSFEGFPCPDTITLDEYHRQVTELAETLNIPDGIEKFTYASCVWIFNHIRAAEGLGIFPHPYWISNVYQIPENLINYMLETQPFDAFEVLGGEVYYEHNGFQTQKYYDMRAKGYDFPIVGSTDSHSSVNNRGSHIASTMVFSPENTTEQLIASIKDKYSVAVDTISTEFRLVGDLRLSKYACFLLNEFFPLHNDLCFEEGRAMKDYVCGVEGAKETLEFIGGRMKKQREKYFAF